MKEIDDGAHLGSTLAYRLASVRNRGAELELHRRGRRAKSNAGRDQPPGEHAGGPPRPEAVRARGARAQAHGCRPEISPARQRCTQSVENGGGLDSSPWTF